MSYNSWCDDTWDDVSLKRTVQRTASSPYASIADGRITFNAPSCNLIPNIYEYSWVNLKQQIRQNHIEKLAFVFSREKGPDSLRVTQRVYKGQKLSGMNIYSKELVRRYFDNNPKNKPTRRFPVLYLADNALAIDIKNEME